MISGRASKQLFSWGMVFLLTAALPGLFALEPEVGHKDHYKRLGVYSNATADEIFHAVENLSIQYASRRGGLRKPIREFLESGEILLDAAKRRSFDAEAGHRNDPSLYIGQASYSDRLRGLRLKLGSLEDGAGVDLLLLSDPTEPMVLEIGRPAITPTPAAPKVRIPDFGGDDKRSLFRSVPKSTVLLFKRSNAEPTPEAANYLRYLNSIFSQAFENGDAPKALIRYMEGILSRVRKEIFFLPSQKSSNYLQTRGEFLTYLKKLRVHTHDESENHEKPKIRGLVNDLLLFDLWMMGFGKYLESPPKKKKLRPQDDKLYISSEDASFATYRKAYRDFLTPEMMAVELGLQDPVFARGLVYRAGQSEVLNVLAWMQRNPDYWLGRIHEVLDALSQLNASRVQFEDTIATLKIIESSLRSGAGADGIGSKCLRPIKQLGQVFRVMIKS